MGNKEGQTFELPIRKPHVVDLFSTQEQRDGQTHEKVIEIPLAEIDDFHAKTVKVKIDAYMDDLVRSIGTIGIQTPLIVVPKDEGRYEVISGHHRKMAASIVGLERLPTLVRRMSRDEADIAYADTNLQRELPISEKAFTYRLKLDAMKRQGERTDLTSAPVGQKFDSKTSREVLADSSPDSPSQIQRYVRLTELIPEVLQMVDDKKIAIRPAVELSYISAENQRALLDTMKSEDATPSLAQALKMKQFSQDGRLNEDVILSIMSERKPNQAEHFKIPRDRISKYFASDTPAKEIADTIEKALQMYRKRQQNKDAR